MKVFEKFMYPLLVLLYALAIYYSHVNVKLFEEQMVAEDGLYQNIIFGTLLFASIMCFYRASILRPFRGPIFSGALILQGVMFLVFASDEISWGQRLFNFATPGFFLTHNTHHQTNIHHLVLFGFNINNVIFTLAVKIIATLYFIIFPYLYPRMPKLKFFVNHYAIPLPRLTHTGLYFLLGLMMGLVNSEYKNVVFEFGFYWILVLMMYNPINDEVFSRRSLVR